MIINEIYHAKEEVAFFFRHANEVAKMNHSKSWPLNNQIWAMAIDSWFKGR
jgi:hypothetical protein